MKFYKVVQLRIIVYINIMSYSPSLVSLKGKINNQQLLLNSYVLLVSVCCCG